MRLSLINLSQEFGFTGSYALAFTAQSSLAIVKQLTVEVIPTGSGVTAEQTKDKAGLHPLLK